MLCATTFSGFLFTLNIYAAGQFKLLQRKLTLSCDATDNTKDVNLETMDELMMHVNHIKLRSCIKQHQLLLNYMERIENLYNPIMLAETLGSVLKIAALGFQILLVIKKKKFYYNSIVHLICVNIFQFSRRDTVVLL